MLVSTKQYGQCLQCQVKQFESFFQEISRLMASFFLKEFWWQILSGQFIIAIDYSMILGYIDRNDRWLTKIME
jgi:hypothetical protein